MAQDLIIGENTYEDVPFLQVPLSGGGGNAMFVDTSGANAVAADIKSGKTGYVNGSLITGNYMWDWEGDELEHIQQLYQTSFALSATDYPTWTPTTTNTSIKATENVATFSTDMLNYEYIVRWIYTFQAAYPSGTTMKAAPVVGAQVNYQSLYKRPNNLTNVRNHTYNSNLCTSVGNVAPFQYYNSSGTLTYTYNSTYGVMAAVQLSAFSNTTSNTPTVTVKAPIINARCSTTYFSTAIAGAIDQDNSILTLKCDLFRCKTGSMLRRITEEAIEIYDDILGN